MAEGRVGGLLDGLRRRTPGHATAQRPPGRPVVVRGVTLHAVVTDGGTPTVVFESALATPSTGWARVAGLLAPEFGTVAYDRPGNGWSPPSRTGTAHSTAVDLGLLLDALGVTGPLVLVGHSVGGLLVRVAAAELGDRVSGMVLVDSSHPDQLERSAAQRDSVTVVQHGLEVMQRRARRGEVTGHDEFGAVAQLPPPAADLTARAMSRPGPWSAAQKELRAWQATWAREARASHLRPDLPLAVVTAGEQVVMDPVHGQLQEELVDLSEVSRHWVVDGATHDGLVMGAPGAEQVADAVRWVCAPDGGRAP